MAICKLCNHENPDDSQFCANCGNILDTKNEAPANKPEVLAPVTAEVVSQNPVIPVPPVAPQPQMQPQPQPYVAQEGPNSQHYGGPNSVPFNTVDQAAYQKKMLNPNKPDYENLCVIAFVFGILGFFFDPLYLISLAAIIMGIIGHANMGSKKTLGMLGWILGLASLICQIIFDFVCSVSTCGIGLVSIFF